MCFTRLLVGHLSNVSFSYPHVNEPLVAIRRISGENNATYACAIKQVFFNEEISSFLVFQRETRPLVFFINTPQPALPLPGPGHSAGKIRNIFAQLCRPCRNTAGCHGLLIPTLRLFYCWTSSLPAASWLVLTHCSQYPCHSVTRSFCYNHFFYK